MKWITRERPKIDRVACPWLIARHIDPEAEVLFVAPSKVAELAVALGATPYDVAAGDRRHRSRCRHGAA